MSYEVQLRRLALASTLVRLLENGSPDRSTNPSRLNSHQNDFLTHVSKQRLVLTHWAAAAAVTLVLERLDGCMRLLRFGVVVSQSLNVIQISVVHPTSDVFTSEDGTFVFLDRGVELRTRLDEIGKRLENDQVGSNLSSNLFNVSVVSDELLSRWHVDTVHVGVSEGVLANSRCGAARD